MYFVYYKLYWYQDFNKAAIRYYIIEILAATPLEASRGTGRRGKSRPHPILNLSFKRVKKIFFGGEVGEDTLSKNSLKPSQGL